MQDLQQKYNTIIEVDRLMLPELLDQDKYPDRTHLGHVKVKTTNRLWTPRLQSLFIDSLLGNVPVSPLVFNQVDGKMFLIDGQKRIKAIRDYLSDKFPLEHMILFDELNGLTFTQLPFSARQILQNRSIHTRVLLNAHPDILSAVYTRFN